MTGELASQLQRLEAFLDSEAAGEDTMLLSELDGFLAGVITCPELIRPSEWLAMVWRTGEPVFDSEDKAQSIINLIMVHYNTIIRQLDQADYRPIYGFDSDGNALWEFWVKGFWLAVSLRQKAWSAFIQTSNEDLRRAILVLSRLGEFAASPEKLEPMDIDDDLEELAPDLIPTMVEILHHTRLAKSNRFDGPAIPGQQKIGRNDPCPCGSGKKYKKCCLS